MVQPGSHILSYKIAEFIPMFHQKIALWKPHLSGIPKFQLNYFNLPKQFRRHQKKMTRIFKRYKDAVESWGLHTFTFNYTNSTWPMKNKILQILYNFCNQGLNSNSIIPPTKNIVLCKYQKNSKFLNIQQLVCNCQLYLDCALMYSVACWRK